MKKTIILSLLTLTMGAAFAQESKNHFFGGAELTTYDSPSFDSGFNILGVKAGYRHFFNDKFSGNVFASYGKDSSEGISLMGAGVGIGYDFQATTNIKIRPNVSYQYFKLSDGGGKGNITQIGLEILPKGNLSYEISYRDLSQKSQSEKVTGVHFGINYKF